MKQSDQVLKKHSTLFSGIGIAASSILLSASLTCVANANWPVAVPDTANTIANQSIVIQVLANDVGNTLVLDEVNTTTVGLGSANINADKQSITYKPAEGFTGEDSFWYNFKDSLGQTNAAQVFVQVLNVVKPSEWPSVVNDSTDATVNTPIKIPVLANDSGVGLKLTQVNNWTVGSGTAEIVDDGQSILYTPASDYTGTDEFWYVLSDQWGRTNAGKVNPVVKSVSSAWPSAIADYTETLSTETVAVNVLQNDTGENLKLKSVNEWTVNGGRARIEDTYIRYTPPADFSGQDSFWYNFEDAQGRANSTQVFVDVTKNSQLSVVEFCGANYETDGTIENTRVVSANDPNAVQLSASVGIEAFPEQDGSVFAAVGDRRYFVVDTSDAKELWMEQAGNTTKIATHAGSGNLYGVGIRDGVLYYSSDNVSDDSLYSHNGEFYKLEGVYEYSGRIKLLARTDGIYYSAFGLLYGRYHNQLYRLNPVSGNAELISATDVPYTAGSVALTGVVMNEGLLYSSTRFSYRASGNTSLAVEDIYTDSDNTYTVPVYGDLDYAIQSNGRTLFVTQSHTASIYNVEQPLAPIRKTYPPTLYSVNANREYVELAVCGE